jgi:hypothetical protein
MLCALQLVQVDVQQTAQPSQTQQQQMTIQRPPVAVPSSTLQQLIIQPTQAAGGHVILQSGQQLISAATGQQVLASVDGRTQQMTIVQGAAATQGGQAAATGTMAAAPLLVSLVLLWLPTTINELWTNSVCHNHNSQLLYCVECVDRCLWSLDQAMHSFTLFCNLFDHFIVS